MLFLSQRTLCRHLLFAVATKDAGLFLSLAKERSRDRRSCEGWAIRCARLLHFLQMSVASKLPVRAKSRTRQSRPLGNMQSGPETTSCDNPTLSRPSELYRIPAFGSSKAYGKQG